MPAVLKINPQKRVVVSTFFGIVTDKEFLNHRETIVGHPDFKPEFDEIVDLTMVSDFQVSATAMQTLATQESVFRPSSKHAVVAPKDVSFEKAEQFKSMANSSRPDLKVVRSAAEAYEFLGLK